jgi:phospholipase/carboxylesterase
MPDSPHDGARVLSTGPPIADAAGAGALVLVHGRGATAESILPLAAELGRDDLAVRAPQAVGRTWYPYSFLAPLERNEPYLSSALELLGRVVGDLEAEGVPSSRIVLAGFSQGACLITEFTARNARRWGAVLAFTGGLLGPPGTVHAYDGDLAGTPVFLGSADPDPHVPVERVEETARVLEGMGAVVTQKIYPGMGHTISRDEIEHARRILEALA